MRDTLLRIALSDCFELLHARTGPPLTDMPGPALQERDHVVKRNNNERAQTLELVNQLREELQRQAATIGGLRSDLHARTDALQQLLEDKDSRSEEIRMLKVGTSCRAALFLTPGLRSRAVAMALRDLLSACGLSLLPAVAMPHLLYFGGSTLAADLPGSSALPNSSQSPPTPCCRLSWRARQSCWQRPAPRLTTARGRAQHQLLLACMPSSRSR